MTIDELKRHQYFTQLSDKQKGFVLARCEDGLGLIAAEMKVRNCKDEKSAVALGNRDMRNPQIKWLISKFFGAAPIPTREELGTEILARARSSSDELAGKLYTLAVNIFGYLTKPVETPPVQQIEPTGSEDFSLDEDDAG
jgi:hypothetical protein